MTCKRRFCRKFFITEDDITIFDRARKVQKPGEEIIDYIKRARDRSLEIREDVTKERLIRICVEGLQDEYRVLFINDAHEIFRKFAEKA